MPATFRKANTNIDSAHAFLEDIIILTKSSLSQHEIELNKVIKSLDEENIPISLKKCEITVIEKIWLGYKIIQMESYPRYATQMP